MLGAACDESQPRSVLDVTFTCPIDGMCSVASVIASADPPTGNLPSVYYRATTHVIPAPSGPARPRSRRSQSLQHYPRIRALWFPIRRVFFSGRQPRRGCAMGGREG